MIGMDINNLTFKKPESGACPYYINDNVKYYITDEKDGSEYKYILVSQIIEKPRLIKLDGAYHVEWMEKNIKDYSINSKLTRYWDGIVFEDKKYNYFATKERINIVTLTKKCSWGFDNYVDCLNHAKEYIYKIMQKKEPEQLMFNIF